MDKKQQQQYIIAMRYKRCESEIDLAKEFNITSDRVISIYNYYFNNDKKN